MNTPSDALYQVMINRDTTFDGELYIAIVTTGIVCFPSCRSRLPKRENVRVFTTLEDALAAGFRPCKRCKPDHPARQSPDTQVVACVMDILQTRYGEPLPLRVLAAELNLSEYHLQKIFKRLTGTTPAQTLEHIRVQAAKQLLTASDRSVTEVSRAVGFSSASHFGVVFHRNVGMTPMEYRLRQE